MGLINRGNGTYQARIKGADGKIISATFATKKAAKEKLIEWKNEKKTLLLGTNRQRQLTVQEFFYEWFDDVSNETHSDSRSGWRKLQLQYYRDYIGPKLGDVQLRAVTPQMAKRVFTEMAKQDKSPQTQCLVYATMRKMFGDAIENYQYVVFNPVIRKIKPVKPEKEAPHLTYHQTKTLLDHVRNESYGLPIWIQLYLGLRYSELRALKLSDLDLDEGRITIRRTYVMKTGMLREFPKGRKQHTHSIPQELLEMLRSKIIRPSDEFVCTNKEGGIMPYRWYLKVLRKYCHELGLPAIGTHGLRHSTSELYLQHGATKDDLQRLFAHSCSRVTERYLHNRGTNLEKVTNVIRLFGDRSDPKVTQNHSSHFTEVRK
jgi:integrase